MRAMLFAAGLGTRLRPHTNTKPKALVEVKGIPLLEIAIHQLIKHGFKEIVINIHHFGELILHFLAEKKNFGIDIWVSDERELLLDTGGGLKKALPMLGQQPFLVFNTDILTDLNLNDLYHFHLKSNALASLAIRQRTSSRYLLFNSHKQLCGWRNVKTGVTKLSRPQSHLQDFGFSGIHVVDPMIEHFMPETPVFSIIQVYLEAAKTELIQGFDHSSSFWMDVGRIPDLEKAQRLPDH